MLLKIATFSLNSVKKKFIANILNLFFPEVNEQVLAPLSNTDSIYQKHEPYIPDFTARATDTLLFLRIKRPHYIVARRATLMGRSQQDNTNEEDAFNKEWKHLSHINQCNHNNVDTKVEIHDTAPTDAVSELAANPSYTSNWTPVPSITNISGLTKRTDSKDSGWSFPASDKHPDTSESDHDLATKESSDRLNSVTIEVPESKDDSHISDGKLECSNHERTSSFGAIDGLLNKDMSMSCDNATDDDMGSGEFTPLVNKEDRKSNGGGDS